KESTLRPRHQLAAAVRADGVHPGRAAWTEGALVAADAGLTIRGEIGCALLARRLHFKRHTVSPSRPRIAAGGDGRVRRLLRAPHRSERHSPCRSHHAVAASSPAAAGNGSAPRFGCSQGASDRSSPGLPVPPRLRSSAPYGPHPSRQGRRTTTTGAVTHPVLWRPLERRYLHRPASQKPGRCPERSRGGSSSPLSASSTSPWRSA